MLVETTRIAADAATAAAQNGDDARGWVALAAAAAFCAVGYRISLRLHPYRPCRACGETGKHRGGVFTASFRACRACGGRGRQLRRFAREP
ncbi:MAG: hypothetical protein ACRDPT_00770 [Streptomycetales bacterium]